MPFSRWTALAALAWPLALAVRAACATLCKRRRP